MKKLVFIIILLTTMGLSVAAHLNLNALESPLLLQEAMRQLAAMQSSSYQHRTHVDEAIGRFDYDCSGFIDYALQKISPEAYAEIPVSKATSRRPLAEDFYSLFSHPLKQASHWERIWKVSLVQAGDIVAWLRPVDKDSTNTGHVMVVSAQPLINPEQTDEILISVIDSTTSPHAHDSRRNGQTGLGTGMIGVIVNSKDEPTAYHWRGGESKQAEETPIAFGRLR